MPGEMALMGNSRPTRRTAPMPVSRDSPESDSGSSERFISRSAEKSDSRVGHEYQAEIPSMMLRETLADLQLKETLIWKPTDSLTDKELNEYFAYAHEKFHYNQEQCYGMLCFHNFDVEATIADLPNYVPYKDEWSAEEKVMFEEAFSQYGKYFSRIKAMLTDKSIASLVNYYYLWKKSGTRKSYLDVKVAKHSQNEGDIAQEDLIDTAKPSGSKKNRCSNNKCGCILAQPSSCAIGPHGPLCHDCQEHFKRTGNMRSLAAVSRGYADAERSQKGSVCPPGMKLDRDQIYNIIKHPELFEKCTNALQTEIANSKRTSQANLYSIALLKNQLKTGVSDVKLPDPGRCRVTNKWSPMEERMATMGFRRYGKNYEAIAAVVGNKRLAHVKDFYEKNNIRFRLDELIAEGEAERDSAETTMDEIVLSDSDDEVGGSDSEKSDPDVFNDENNPAASSSTMA